MIELLKAYQLDLMLFLSGICFILAILTILTRALSPARRRILAILETAATLLLISDRFAYIYHGDPSPLGYWMVRISNFLVFLLPLVIAHETTLYIADLLNSSPRGTMHLKRLTLCEILFITGTALVIISQFTGLYYTFDAQNVYHRSPASPVCYVIHFTIMVLQLSVIIQYQKTISKLIAISLLLDAGISTFATIVQVFVYGISLINMSFVGTAALLYIFAILDLNKALETARKHEVEYYKDGEKRIRTLFGQTVEALVNVIDAKDRYTNGHSLRVAEYSRQLAGAAGKDKEYCDRIYYAGLLHDVGKISIPRAILNKKGRLTKEEYDKIQKHPVTGGQILSSIHQAPYLSIGAKSHHERYDGRGYPERLKGEDIPEIARIIAVADAYDAMSSNRSYRNAIPQHMVREEILKGLGTQFDPVYGKLMIRLIDQDTEYQMREMQHSDSTVSEIQLHCESVYNECGEGICVTDQILRMRLNARPTAENAAGGGIPSLIVFDSLDAKVHVNDDMAGNLMYVEYGQIRFDGFVQKGEVRAVDSKTIQRSNDGVPCEENTPGYGKRYDIEAVKCRDHLLVRISDDRQMSEIIMAMPDCSRFVYLSITGEHCDIGNICTQTENEKVRPDYIPRIAEEISFIKDCPEGMIPNIQIDNSRSDTTAGIPIAGRMTLTFHTMSLPTARLVWHCPFLCVFTSDNGLIDGNGYREYVLLRLDGEVEHSDGHARNSLTVRQTDDFEGWNVWKQRNKQGLDCRISIERKGNQIILETQNLGIWISDTVTIEDAGAIYVALTGDQCAITNIQIAGQPV